jgi:hypothetical protein
MEDDLKKKEKKRGRRTKKNGKEQINQNQPNWL